jgi:hypothetical protein
VSDKVMVGIAVNGHPQWQFVDGLLSLESAGYALKRAGKPDRPLPIPDAYNELARACLESDCDWLFNVNQDCLLHPQTLTRLLSWGQPIVAPLAYTRYSPTCPMVWSERAGERAGYYRIQYEHVASWVRAHAALCTDAPAVIDEIPDDALYPITEGFLSTHCLLIHRSVLEAVGDPWFVRVTRPGDQGTGCDRFFSEQATQAGFTLHVDMSQQVGHLRGESSVASMSFLAWNEITDWNTKQFTVMEGKDNG